MKTYFLRSNLLGENTHAWSKHECLYFLQPCKKCASKQPQTFMYNIRIFYEKSEQCTAKKMLLYSSELRGVWGRVSISFNLVTNSKLFFLAQKVKLSQIGWKASVNTKCQPLPHIICWILVRTLTEPY